MKTKRLPCRVRSFNGILCISSLMVIAGLAIGHSYVVFASSAEGRQATTEPTDATRQAEKIAERIHKALGSFDEPFDSEVVALIRTHPDIVASVARNVLEKDVDRGEGIVVTANALGIIGTLDEARASPLADIVAPYLGSEVDFVRIAAIKATAHCGGHRYISSIVLLLDDPEFTVRYRAMEALGEIGRAEDVVALELWLERTRSADEDRPVGHRWLQGAILDAIERTGEQMADAVK